MRLNKVIISQVTFRNCREYFCFPTTFLETSIFVRVRMSVGNLNMQRFWATDGNQKCAVFLFNMEISCIIIIYLTCLHTTTIILLSVFSLVEKITLQDLEFNHVTWSDLFVDFIFASQFHSIIQLSVYLK